MDDVLGFYIVYRLKISKTKRDYSELWKLLKEQFKISKTKRREEKRREKWKRGVFIS